MVKRAVANLIHPNSIVEVDAGMDEAFKILKSGKRLIPLVFDFPVCNCFVLIQYNAPL